MDKPKDKSAAMSIQTPIQRPLQNTGKAKTEPRAQFAVLPWRLEPAKSGGKSGEKIRICLVTSRGTRRWILPKGWPMGNLTPARAAEIEAWEEAGLRGIISPQPIGLYSYRKRLDNGDLPVIAVVYGMQVTSVAKVFPERAQRNRKWLSPRKAAARLDDDELAHIVRHFDPRNRLG
ncbi:NUDIX hydrolase [Roseisalinus antarcticus]|uniref:NUDIX domain protein n=1 Tax=Roseisalinus antarcticus TaxID=254357 RepID=A0A1Y5SRI0_9RHOB|nr:NUDIX hydrolase [Roseisalinus antarcticus]SLN46621.1 hypothetical protein ROA7023_01932 [Roseisalinus antarcticus]